MITQKVNFCCPNHSLEPTTPDSLVIRCNACRVPLDAHRIYTPDGFVIGYFRQNVTDLALREMASKWVSDRYPSED